MTQHIPENTNTQQITPSSKIEDKVVFFFVAMGIVTVTFALFAAFDFLPEKPSADAEAAAEVVTETEADGEEEEVADIATSEALPITIYFDSLEREVKVLNPESSTVEALDSALLSGVVRHPDSADFLNTGTIFLLGHSSYLPNVRNQNFQAFNGIQKLEWGDTIRLRSEDVEYIYTVDKVYEAKASSAEVPMQFDEAKLILATCNSFGTKDDRYIVEATLVAKRPYSAS